MKTSSVALLAGVGILGYVALKKSSTGVIPTVPGRRAGTVYANGAGGYLGYGIGQYGRYGGAGGIVGTLVNDIFGSSGGSRYSGRYEGLTGAAYNYVAGGYYSPGTYNT